MHPYRFSTFVLDPKERRLLRDGAPISLAPKAFDTLVYLVERAGHLVGKQELMQAIWRDSCVEDGNLPRTIHILRRALGEEGGGPRYIETIPTKGYRFVADIVLTNAEKDPSALSVAPVTPVSAVARMSGTGPRSLVGIGVAAFVFVAIAAGLISAGVGQRRAALEPTGIQTTSGAAYKNHESLAGGSGRAALLRSAFESGGWPAVLRASLPPGQPRRNLETAETLAQLGETDSAFEVLDAMIDARRVMIVHMDSDPRLDRLREDPRFEQIARRVGLR